MEYRSEIDGLRAIAVLLVLIYHGDFGIFPSGFIGVDIFFVISGFLITKLIDDSFKKGAFSFSNFYSRRLWRLQPLFIFSLFVTTALASIFLLPEDLMAFSKSLQSIVLFQSNHHFYNVTTGYFASDAKQLPLLHTWSLAIEWQCYFLFPILFYTVYRMSDGRHIKLCIYACTLVFLLLTIYYSFYVNNTTSLYYMFSARFFEFLIGSCVALISYSYTKLHRQSLFFLTFLPVIAILYIASQTNIKLDYPNYYALIICVATGSIIILGQSHPQNLLIRLLSLKPLVFIGMLSYSLYLWHWIFFSLFRYQNVIESLPILVFIYFLTSFIAYISWRYIEKPMRKFYSIQRMYTVILLLFFPIAIGCLINPIIKKMDGFPQRFSRIYTTEGHYPRRINCMGDRHINKKSTFLNLECQLGSIHPNSKTALMIGDSFSNHSWGLMDILGKEANVSVVSLAMPACLMLPEVFLLRKGEKYISCYEHTERYYKMIASRHYDYVIIGENWLPYLIGHKKNIRKALNNAIQIIIHSGSTPVLISYPAVADNYGCFVKQFKRFQSKQKSCDFNLAVNNDTQWFDVLLKEMKNNYPSLIIIDPKIAQCTSHKCRASINGIPMYRDYDGHITDYASAELAKIYLSRQKNPLVIG